MRVPFVSPNAPVVEVRLAGRAIANVLGLVDTGASSVALSRDTAELLGYDLTQAQVAEIRTVGGIAHVPAIALAEVAVGKTSVRNVRAVCIHFQDPEVEVLIGLSFLRHFVVTLDFKRGFLVLEDH